MLGCREGVRGFSDKLLREFAHGLNAGRGSLGFHAKSIR